MYYAFVLYYLLLERAASRIPVAGFAQRLAKSVLWQRAYSTFLRVPFIIYPLALLGLSIAFTMLVDRARSFEPADVTSRDLPLQFIYVHDKNWVVAYMHVRALAFFVVCSQSLTLAALYAATRTRKLKRFDIAVTVVAIAGFFATSFLYRTLESTDIYSYVANARLGMIGSYASHIRVSDPGLRGVTELTWGVLPPSPYGPLCHLYNGWVANTSSLVQATLRIRAYNASILVILIVGLVAARVRPATILLLGLNPFVYQQFIVNAHNDLTPVAALTLGAVFARRSMWFPVVAAIAAGLIKLPLCLVGIVTLVAIRSRAVRVTMTVLIVATVAVLSLAFGGEAYIEALLNVSNRAVTHDRMQAALHAFAAVLALFSIGYAILTRRRFWPGLVAIPTLSGSMYPWYLFWLVPTAFAGVDVAAPLLIAFPVVSLFLSDVFGQGGLVRVVSYGLIGLAAVCYAAMCASSTSGNARTNRLASRGGISTTRVTAAVKPSSAL